MRTEIEGAKAAAGYRSELWYWSLVNAAGRQVETGQGSDQASARRHARRSALLRKGTFAIHVSTTKPPKRAKLGQTHS